MKQSLTTAALFVALTQTGDASKWNKNDWEQSARPVLRNWAKNQQLKRAETTGTGIRYLHSENNPPAAAAIEAKAPVEKPKNDKKTPTTPREQTEKSVNKQPKSETQDKKTTPETTNPEHSSKTLKSENSRSESASSNPQTPQNSQVGRNYIDPKLIDQYDKIMAAIATQSKQFEKDHQTVAKADALEETKKAVISNTEKLDNQIKQMTDQNSKPEDLIKAIGTKIDEAVSKTDKKIEAMEKKIVDLAQQKTDEQNKKAKEVEATKTDKEIKGNNTTNGTKTAGNNSAISKSIGFAFGIGLTVTAFMYSGFL